MNNLFIEGNLQINFTNCIVAQRFDESSLSAHGMRAVDFLMETACCLYYIEVKDYQNPHATKVRQLSDYQMLIDATKNTNEFILKMGEKIKDSLLRNYAEGNTFTKKVKYIFLLNFDKLGVQERSLLFTKIIGQVPMGLNNKRFNAFKKLSFELLDANKIKKYGIICTNIS